MAISLSPTPFVAVRMGCASLLSEGPLGYHTTWQSRVPDFDGFPRPHMTTPSSRPTMRLELCVLQEKVVVEAPQPESADVRLDEVLPLLRAIDDGAIDVAV